MAVLNWGIQAQIRHGIYRRVKEQRLLPAMISEMQKIVHGNCAQADWFGLLALALIFGCILIYGTILPVLVVVYEIDPICMLLTFLGIGVSTLVKLIRVIILMATAQVVLTPVRKHLVICIGMAQTAISVPKYLTGLELTEVQIRIYRELSVTEKLIHLQNTRLEGPWVEYICFFYS